MTGKCVLIVEDNPLNMELATDLLEAAGFHVLGATTGERGIELARQAHPDVILMDVDLPGMNGLDATRVLKADAGTRNIPVAALTAFAMAGDEGKAQAAGCVGYLTKPIDTRQFAGQVMAILLSEDAAP